MKKGIVMEQKRNYTIVMTNDGRFHRANLLEQAEVGMEVHFEHVNVTKRKMVWATVAKHNYLKVAIVALAMILMLFPVYSWYDGNQVYAYIHLDMNPSVELEVNDDMEVIAIHPMNAEAEEIVSMLSDWKHRAASDVTLQIIKLGKENGYVNEENQVLIGVSYTETEDDPFSEELESFLEEQNVNMSVAAYFIPLEIRKKAEAENQSVNAYMAEKLNEKKESSDSSLSVSVEQEDKEIILSYYDEDTPAEAKSLEDQVELLPKKVKIKDAPKMKNGPPAHAKAYGHKNKAEEKDIKAQKKSQKQQEKQEKKSEKKAAHSDKGANKSKDKHHKGNPKEPHAHGKDKHSQGKGKHPHKNKNK